MNLANQQTDRRTRSKMPFVAMAVALALPITACGQAKPMDKATHDAHVAAGAMPTTAPSGAVSGDQIKALRAKTAQIDADLKQRQAGGAMAGMKGDAMPMGGGTTDEKKPMGMAMMDMPMDKMPPDKPMPGPAMAPQAPGAAMPMAPGMKDDKMPMGMGMMAMMDDMMGMPPASVAPAMRSGLPGFPGASHIYHIGGTSFFLDHAEHVALTVPQQAALNAAKEKALLDQATAQRDIDAGEQALWTLTAAGQPDIDQIEKQVRAVEKSRGDQRLAFIRAVGEAAKILTDPQRQALLGMAPPQTPAAAPMAMPPAAAPAAPAPATPAPAAPAAPAMPPMGDM